MNFYVYEFKEKGYGTTTYSIFKNKLCMIYCVKYYNLACIDIKSNNLQKKFAVFKISL